MNTKNKKAEKAKRLIEAVLVLGIAIFMYATMYVGLGSNCYNATLCIILLIIPLVISLMFFKVFDIRNRILKKILLTCLILISLGLSCAVNMEWGYSISFCDKCYMRKWHRYVWLYGHTLMDREKVYYSDIPQLKSVQQKCNHLCQAGSGRSSSLFYTESGHSSASIAFFWARGYELSESLEFVVTYYLEYIRDDEYLSPEDKKRYKDEWAWFMQQAIGHDFGITFDDDSCQPKVTDGTVEKILDWWEADGKKLYGSQPE